MLRILIFVMLKCWEIAKVLFCLLFAATVLIGWIVLCDRYPLYTLVFVGAWLTGVLIFVIIKTRVFWPSWIKANWRKAGEIEKKFNLNKE